MDPIRLHLRERITELQEAAPITRLRASQVYPELADSHILEITMTRDEWAIKTGPYVGVLATENELTLEIAEKVPGTLVALAKIVHPASFRKVEAKTPLGDESRFEPFLEALVRHFLSLMRQAVELGLLREYQERWVASSNPRGAVDFRASVNRYWAKGTLSRVVHRQLELTADIPVNRILRHCVLISRMYADSRGLTTMREESSALLYSLRRLSSFDNRVMVPNYVKSVFRRLHSEGYYDTGPYGTLLRIAEVLATRARLLGSVEVWETTIPHSFLINMETLFEDAVFEALKQVITGADVVIGSTMNQFILPDATIYQAEPDYVVMRDGKASCVLDAKYKELTGNPSQSDLYQIIAHTEAFGSHKAVLVYPSDTQPSHRRLGTMRNGLWVAVVEARPAHLVSDLAVGLGKIGVICARENADGQLT